MVGVDLVVELLQFGLCPPSYDRDEDDREGAVDEGLDESFRAVPLEGPPDVAKPKRVQPVQGSVVGETPCTVVVVVVAGSPVPVTRRRSRLPPALF